MLRPLVLAAVTAAVAAGAAGCVTPSQRREESLMRAAREYADGLRWGRYDQVTPHLAAEEAERFLAASGALGDDFAMADDEVASVRFVEAGLRADVTVDFTWYRVRQSLVRRTLVAQEWRYRDGRWTLAAQRRLSGDRFPFVAEPAATAPPPAPTTPPLPAAR